MVPELYGSIRTRSLKTMVKFRDKLKKLESIFTKRKERLGKTIYNRNVMYKIIWSSE